MCLARAAPACSRSTVQHGFRFTDKSQSAFIPSPNSTNPPTPGVPGTPVREGAQTPEAPPCDELELLTKPEPTPYYCFGFTVQNALTYISDTSHIPDEAWDYIRASHSGGRPPVLVLDCLRLEPHKSHLSLAQAVDVARRMGAPRTYLTGFSHEVSHEEYRTLLESVGGRLPPAKERWIPIKRRTQSQMCEGGIRMFMNSLVEPYQECVQSQGMNYME